MAARKRSVEVEIVVDDKNAAKNLNNLDKNVSKSGKTLSNFAKIAAGAFAFDKIVDFGRAAVGAFSDLNESTNAVNVTFGEAAGGILELGENAARSVGLANAEFNQLAVGFSAFANEIAGASGQDVVTVLEDLTTRIADFASVMNIDIPEAADKFRSGLAGETEPLRKFGLDVSAAAVNAKALELGLAGSSSEMTEQDKILARYHLIMDQTQKTAGDFANTSDELANRQRILQAEFKDAQAALGEGLVPAMVSLLEVGNDVLPWVLRFADGFAEATGSIEFAELALRRVESALGLSRDSAAGFAEALVQLKDDSDKWWLGGANQMQRFIDNLEDLTDKTDLSSQEVERLISFFPTLVERLELSEEQASALATALDVELAEATMKARGEAHSFERGWNAASREADKAAGSVRFLSDEMLAAADPAFALLKANEGFVTAQQKYNEAVGEFGPDSAQAREAAADLLETAGRYNAAQKTFAEEHGPEGEEALRRLAAEAGFYGDDLDRVLAFLDSIDSTTRGLPPVYRRPGGGSAVGPFHEGGTVPGTPGSDQLIMAQAGETVSRRADAGGGGGMIHNVIMLDGKVLYEEVKKRAVKDGRQNVTSGIV